MIQHFSWWCHIFHIVTIASVPKLMTQDLRISARQLQMFIDESPDQIQFKAGHPWPKNIDGPECSSSLLPWEVKLGIFLQLQKPWFIGLWFVDRDAGSWRSCMDDSIRPGNQLPRWWVQLWGTRYRSAGQTLGEWLVGMVSWSHLKLKWKFKYYPLEV